MMPACRIVFQGLLVAGLWLACIGQIPAGNWPAWRGPNADGHSAERNLPLKWSPQENVFWKVPLDEPGNSTPIVWGDRIFLTQAAEKGRKRSLLCFERHAGRLLWRQTIAYGADEPTHPTNPYCSASPVTDGERVIVSFGSAGLAAYDFAGKLLWHRELGKCLHVWGNAASPVIHGDLVLVNFGPGVRTFLLAVDKRTGREAWRAEEPGGKLGDKGPSEWIGSWSTPAVTGRGGRDEAIMSWPRAIKSYSPRTGELLWSSRGLDKDNSPSQLVYTSPLVTAEMTIAMGGYGGSALAVRSGGIGDVTQTHRLWRVPVGPQRIGSGVIVGEHLYIVNTPGTFECFELKTGKSLWAQRIGGETWSSLVCADGRLYVTTLEGETIVLAAGPKVEVLARNPLKERTLASIGVSDGQLFLRTYQHLWCIGNRGPTN